MGGSEQNRVGMAFASVSSGDDSERVRAMGGKVWEGSGVGKRKTHDQKINPCQKTEFEAYRRDTARPGTLPVSLG